MNALSLHDGEGFMENRLSSSFLPFYIVTFLAPAIFFLKMALITSMEKNTTMPKPSIIPRSEAEGLSTPKASRMDGIWRSAAVNRICDRIERTSHRWGGDLKMLYRIDRKFKR